MDRFKVLGESQRSRSKPYTCSFGVKVLQWLQQQIIWTFTANDWIAKSGQIWSNRSRAELGGAKWGGLRMGEARQPEAMPVG